MTSANPNFNTACSPFFTSNLNQIPFPHHPSTYQTRSTLIPLPLPPFTHPGTFVGLVACTSISMLLPPGDMDMIPSLLIPTSQSQGCMAWVLCNQDSFFAVTVNHVKYHCALVHWYSLLRDSPDKCTGMWVVEPDILDDGQAKVIIKFSSIYFLNDWDPRSIILQGCWIPLVPLSTSANPKHSDEIWVVYLCSNTSANQRLCQLIVLKSKISIFKLAKKIFLLNRAWQICTKILSSKSKHFKYFKSSPKLTKSDDTHKLSS